VTDSGAELHSDRCHCCTCVCRRYLSWRSPDNSPTPTVKIARWGGSTGTGEPDRAFDQVVTTADLSRALHLVVDPWLKYVGEACRDVPPGPHHPFGCTKREPAGSPYHPHACPNRVPWPDRAEIAPDPKRWVPRPAFFVVNRLKVVHPSEWAVSEATFPDDTLFRLRQKCAEAMAAVLGAQFGAEPIVGRDVEEPPEFADAPALRRYR